MKYFNSTLLLIFIFIPNVTNNFYGFVGGDYLRLVLLLVVLLNYKKLNENKHIIFLGILIILKFTILLSFNSNSYVCYGDNNIEPAQSSQFKVGESKCKTSFNNLNKNLDYSSERIVSINNKSFVKNNQSIQNTNWNIGFLNDKKYNYFREYEQSRNWFPIEATYYIDNSNLNNRNIKLNFSGQVTVIQDNIEIYRNSSFESTKEISLNLDSKKDFQINYSFNNFATDITVPSYEYATLIMTDELGSVIKLVKYSQIINFIELLIYIIFIYFFVYQPINENFNTFSLIFIVGIFVTLNTNIVLTSLFLLLLIATTLFMPVSKLTNTNVALTSIFISTMSLKKFFPFSETIYQIGGTDGLRYESHARQIFFSNSLQGGEDLFTSQPGARYILFLLKLIFGENDVLQKIFILSILCICFYLIKIKNRNLTTTFIAIVSFAYIISSPIVLLVTESLSETFAWPIITILFVFLTYEIKCSKSILAMLGLIVLIRLNYLPVSIILLFLFNTKNLIKLKDLYIFLTFILIPSLHNFFYGGEFQFWLRSIDTQSNIRLDTENLFLSVLNNIKIILGDYTNEIISDYVGIQFLLVQYCIIFIFLMTTFIALSKKKNMITLYYLFTPLLFLMPHLLFDGLTEYPKHMVSGYISMLSISMLLNKDTKILTKLKYNRAIN
jgi:hypothetical protein